MLILVIAGAVPSTGQALRPTSGCATAVDSSQHHAYPLQSTDDSVASALRAAGLRVESHPGYLLYEPADVRIDMGGRWCGHFGTLTPFHRWARPVHSHRREPYPSPFCPYQ